MRGMMHMDGGKLRLLCLEAAVLAARMKVITIPKRWSNDLVEGPVEVGVAFWSVKEGDKYTGEVRAVLTPLPNKPKA